MNNKEKRDQRAEDCQEKGSIQYLNRTEVADREIAAERGLLRAVERIQERLNPRDIAKLAVQITQPRSSRAVASGCDKHKCHARAKAVAPDPRDYDIWLWSVSLVESLSVELVPVSW